MLGVVSRKLGRLGDCLLFFVGGGGIWRISRTNSEEGKFSLSLQVVKFLGGQASSLMTVTEHVSVLEFNERGAVESLTRLEPKYTLSLFERFWSESTGIPGRTYKESTVVSTKIFQS